MLVLTIFSLYSLIVFYVQYRGSEIFELQNFRPASTDDIARVHAKSYVSGLERVTSYSLFLVVFLFLDSTRSFQFLLLSVGYGYGLKRGSYLHCRVWPNLCYNHRKEITAEASFSFSFSLCLFFVSIIFFLDISV